MKNVFTLLAIALMISLIACEPSNNRKSSFAEKAKADSILLIKKNLDSIATVESITRLTLAKNLTDKMFEYIEQSEMKKISKVEFEKLAKHLKAKQDSLRKTLTADQIKELDTYFQKKGNEMVDRLVQYKK